MRERVCVCVCIATRDVFFFVDFVISCIQDLHENLLSVDTAYLSKILFFFADLDVLVLLYVPTFDPQLAG